MVIGGGLVVVGVRAMPARVGDAGVVPPPSATAATGVGGTPSGAARQGAGAARPHNAAPAFPDPGARAVTASPGGRVGAFPPTGVQLPSLGVAATITPVAIGADRLLGVPSDVRTVGWWSGGAAAGAPSGTVVLVGHVDSAAMGPGAFFQLRRIEPGDHIRLTGDGGRVATYTVVARRQYPKSALPADLVFGQGNAARLVLITCGGRFDPATRHYSDNVIVFSVPAH